MVLRESNSMIRSTFWVLMNPYEAPQSTEESVRNPRMIAGLFLAIAIPVVLALTMLGWWLYHSRDRMVELQKIKKDSEWSMKRGKVQAGK